MSNNLRIPDGTPTLVYYDRAAGALVVSEFRGSWSRSVVDASTTTDVGYFASASFGGDGLVHIAYQDAISDRLLYTTWSTDSTGVVEIVDDGTRTGDRQHPVGAGAAIFFDASGALSIAYQDGATSDLLLATRDDESTWTRRDLLSGANLFGFFTDATTVRGNEGRSVISSYFYDRGVYPPGELVIVTVP